MQYAIERGIEAVFQLEDSELASERLNDADDRGRLLFVEAAEGGAGVLRRLQSEPDAMAKVAAKAWRYSMSTPSRGKKWRTRAFEAATAACCHTATSAPTNPSTAGWSSTFCKDWQDPGRRRRSPKLQR
jgi:hypothetical protein